VALCLASLRASAWHGRGSNRSVAPPPPARRARLGASWKQTKRPPRRRASEHRAPARPAPRAGGPSAPQGSESQPAPRRRTSGVPPAYLTRTSDVPQAYLRRTSHSRATRTSNICFLDNLAGTLVKLRTSRTSDTTYNAYLTRTSDVPQAYLRRTSAVPQTYLSRTSDVPRPWLGWGLAAGHACAQVRAILLRWGVPRGTRSRPSVRLWRPGAQHPAAVPNIPRVGSKGQEPRRAGKIAARASGKRQAGTDVGERAAADTAGTGQVHAHEA
jgi:hypothetical protein